MIFFQFEPFLQNLSFSILFLSLLFFWIQASFSLDLTQKPEVEAHLDKISFVSASGVSKPAMANINLNFVQRSFQEMKMGSFGTLGIFIANITLGFLLIFRWMTNGYFPLSNLYESLMFLSWSFTLLHLLLEKIVLVDLKSSKEAKKKNSFIGVITAPMALFTNAFASFSLPLDMQKANSLVPALQSNWLMMHVTVMMLSYATLLMGCVLSIAFLVLTHFQSKILSNKNFFPGWHASNVQTSDLQELSHPNNLVKTDFVLEKEQKLEFFKTYYSSLAKNLDNLSYRILGIGFPLLTIGILSGAVWANEAWGSYWSWDPKETWALITWLIFASYFHVRITKGWSGKKPAILASVGFLIIWVCYLGVNLIGKGLHSYGWIST